MASNLPSNDHADLGFMPEDHDDLGFVPEPTKPAEYSQMQSLEDMLRGLGQGATFGHLPQVTGALSSGAVSGPEYEAAKLKSRAALNEARKRNAPLVFGGELAGGIAVPLGTLSGEAGALRSALTGAGVAAAQNPGGDIDTANLKLRALNALIGGTVGGAAGALSSNAGTMAEQRAFKALGPSKRDVKIARQRGNLESTGRSLLDDAIIGKRPVSRDTLLDRVEAAKQAAGQTKGNIIDELSQLEQQYIAKFGHHPKQSPGLVPTGRAGEVMPSYPNPVVAAPGAHGGIDLDAIRESVKKELSLNPNLPKAPSRGKHLEEFTAGIAQGKKSLPVKEADKLKTDTGVYVNWMRQNSMGTEPESQAFHKELYNALNKGVDDAAEVLAREYKPELLEGLSKSKKTYGNMSTAEQVLDNRISGDFANRMVSPSDYGVGAAVAGSNHARGNNVAKSAMLGATAAGINQFLRTYGNQLSAKQLDNLSRLLQNNKFNFAFKAATTLAPGASIGAKERRRKALEE